MSTSPDSSSPWRPASGEFPAAPPKFTAEEPAAAPARRGQRIAYLASLKFVLSNPEWLKGVLIGGLCMLICMFVPVVAQLILLGYSYEITERLHRRLTASYEIFDFRQIVKYMTRGVWPCIIAIVVQGIVQPLIQFPMQGSIMGTMIALEQDEMTGTIVGAVAFPLLFLFLAALIIALVLFLTPIMLRAGLSQDLAATLKPRWVMDFIKRTWLETILVNLFITLAGLVLILPACALFCFPGFVVAVALTTAGAHLNWQLYELFLARGGEPIPLKLPEPAQGGGASQGTTTSESS